MSNKVKIGDRVKLKPNRIQWARDNIDTYIRPNGELEWELYAKDLYIHKDLVGECTGYSCIDERFKIKGRRFIKVQFQTPLGPTFSYYSEADVLVKRKK